MSVWFSFLKYIYLFLLSAFMCRYLKRLAEMSSGVWSSEWVIRLVRNDRGLCRLYFCFSLQNGWNHNILGERSLNIKWRQTKRLNVVACQPSSNRSMVADLSWQQPMHIYPAVDSESREAPQLPTERRCGATQLGSYLTSDWWVPHYLPVPLGGSWPCLTNAAGPW